MKLLIESPGPGYPRQEGIRPLVTEKLPDYLTRAWGRLVRAPRAVVGAIEADVKAAGLLSLDWYDVLLELERAETGLRPFELERRLLFAQYNLSRLIDRMVEAGLVRKDPCPEDKRGHLLAITEAGLRQRKETWPVYAKAISRRLGEKLTKAETEKLAGLLGKLLAR